MNCPLCGEALAERGFLTKLNAKGREEAVKTLNDALDPNIQDEWNPDKKTPRKLGPRKKA